MMIMYNPNHLPEYIETGKIKAFCGWGFNSFIWPQPQQYQEALKKLDFAFCADYFYRKESHRDMDLILPAAFSRSGAQSTKPQWLLCLRFPRWNAERTNRKNMKKGCLDRMDKPALIRLRARSSSSQHDVQNLVSTVCRSINR